MVGVATGLQKQFSWAGVAAAGVGAGVANWAGARLPDGIGEIAGRAITGAAHAIGSTAARSLIEGSDFGGGGTPPDTLQLPQHIRDDLVQRDAALREPGVVAARIGQIADLGGGLRVRPLEVVEDSRCPQNARCIWAGRLRVRVAVEGVGEREVTLDEGTFETRARRILNGRRYTWLLDRLAGKQPPALPLRLPQGLTHRAQPEPGCAFAVVPRAVPAIDAHIAPIGRQCSKRVLAHRAKEPTQSVASVLAYLQRGVEHAALSHRTPNRGEYPRQLVRARMMQGRRRPDAIERIDEIELVEAHHAHVDVPALLRFSRKPSGRIHRGDTKTRLAQRSRIRAAAAA